MSADAPAATAAERWRSSRTRAPRSIKVYKGKLREDERGGEDTDEKEEKKDEWTRREAKRRLTQPNALRTKVRLRHANSGGASPSSLQLIVYVSGSQIQLVEQDQKVVRFFIQTLFILFARSVFSPRFYSFHVSFIHCSDSFVIYSKLSYFYKSY